MVQVVLNWGGLGWGNDCTGFKVELGGKPYVVTAAHCFYSAIMDVNKVLPGLDMGRPPGHTGKLRTVQLLDPTQLYATFGIRTVKADGTIATGRTAKVTTIGVLTFPTDIALLEVDPTGPAGRAFDKVPAYPYDSVGVGKGPVPGEGVALYSTPNAGDGSAVAATGVFLGTIPDLTMRYRSVFVVGLSPAKGVKQACTPGASGSAAVTASGYVLPPLTFGLQASSYKYQPHLYVRLLKRAVARKLPGLSYAELNDSFPVICGFGDFKGSEGPVYRNRDAVLGHLQRAMPR